MNDIVTWIIAVPIIIYSIYILINSFRKQTKGEGCSGCSGCSVSDKCGIKHR